MPVHQSLIRGLCLGAALMFIAGNAAAVCEPDSPRSIIDSMINLDVSDTDSKIRQLEMTHPNHPILDFLKAMAILNRAYTTETIDRSVEEQALVPLIETVKKARARIQSGDNDPQVQLALGLSQAFVGSIYFAHEKSLKAYKYASAGHTTLENLVAEHPEVEDAYLGLGLFNYYLGSIESKGMKWGAKMMGLSGDRELGLSYLEQAAQNAPIVAPVAARVLLMEVDLPDEEMCKYAGLAAQMRDNYPMNRIFSLIARIIPLQCRLAESDGLPVYPDNGMQLSNPCLETTYTSVPTTLEEQMPAATATVIQQAPVVVQETPSILDY
jgi:hypothetical protein